MKDFLTDDEMAQLEKKQMPDFISDEEMNKIQSSSNTPDFISDDEMSKMEQPVTIPENPPTPIADALTTAGNTIGNLFTPTAPPPEDISIGQQMASRLPPNLTPTREAPLTLNPNDPRAFVPATPTDINLQAAGQTVQNMGSSTPTAATELAEGAGTFGVNVAQNLTKLIGGTNSGLINTPAEIAKNILQNITENTRQYYTGEKIDRPIGAEANTENLPESKLTRQSVEDYIAKTPNLSENVKGILRAKAQPETVGQAVEKTITNTPGAKGIINDAKGLAEFITVAPVESFKTIRIALADAGMIDANTSDDELKQEILKNPMGVFGRIAASALMGYGVVKGGAKAIDKARTNVVGQTPVEFSDSAAASEQNMRDTVKQSADFQAATNRNPEYYQNTVKPANQKATQTAQAQAKEMKANAATVPDTSNYYPEIRENNLTTKDEIVGFYKGKGENINREEAARRRNIAWPDQTELDAEKGNITTTGPNNQPTNRAASPAFDQPLDDLTPQPGAKIGMFGAGTMQNIYEKAKTAYDKTQEVRDIERDKGRLIDKTNTENGTVDNEYRPGVSMFGGKQLQDAYDYLMGNNKTPKKSTMAGDPYYEDRQISLDETNKLAQDIQKENEARKPSIGTSLKQIVQDKYSLPQKVLGTAKDRTLAQKVSTAINDIHYKKTFLSSMVNDISEDVFTPLQSAGIPSRDFETFLDANRYLNEIETKDAANNIDPRKFAVADRMLIDLKKNNPEAFQKMTDAKENFADLWKIHVLDPIYESGIIDKNHYDNLLKNRDYVRFTTAEKFLKSLEAGSAGTEAGARIEKLKGTNKEHMDTLWATLEKGASLKSLAIENNARREFMNLYKNMSPNEIMEGTATKHNFKYFENGEAKYVNFKDADLAKTLNDPHAGISQVPGVPAALSLFSALHKLGTMVYIKLSPSWFLANLALDAGDVAAIPVPIPDKLRIYGNYPKTAAKEITAEIKGKRSTEVRQLERMGAIMPQSESFISDSTKTPLEQTLGTAGDKLKSWLNPEKMTLYDKIKAVGNFIANIPDKAVKPAENMPKIAAYNVLKNKLPLDELKEKIRETGSPEFLKQGTLTPAFGAGAMFVNPNIQGTARVLKHISKNPMGAAVMMSPFILWGLSRLNNYYYGDDKVKDEAHKRPLRDYINYAIVPVGGKEVRFPNPRPVRLLLNMLAGLSEKDFFGFMQRANDVYSDLAPSMAPWLRNAKTVYDASTGEMPTDYTGKPIASDEVLKARDSRLWGAVGKQIYNDWFGGLFGYADTDPIKAQEKAAFPQENDTMIYKGFGGQSLHRFVRKPPTEQAWDSLKKDKAINQDAPRANAELLGQEIGIDFKSDLDKYKKIRPETFEKMNKISSTMPPEYQKTFTRAIGSEMKKLNSVGLSNEARQFMMMSKDDKAIAAQRMGEEKLEKIVTEIETFYKNKGGNQ